MQKSKKVEEKKAITVKKLKNESTPVKYKFKADKELEDLEQPLDSHKRSQSMREVTAKDLMNYNEWNVSEKIKKELEKKYSTLTNKVQALKRKEKQMEIKMSAMKKKSNEIEEIKRKKKEFKNEVNQSKAEKLRKLKEQKEKVKNMRLYEYNKQLTLNEMTNQKKKLILEINKADQNLMKTMLSQTQSKTEANNRLKYLKEKEHMENNKKMFKAHKENEILNKKFKNKVNYDNNLNKSQDLKNKCKELEKLESEYKTELKFNKNKIGEINHPANYIKNYRNDFGNGNKIMRISHLGFGDFQDKSRTIGNNADFRSRGNKTPIPQRRGFRP